jgi:predicted RNase H-like HicB family nuclease
MAKAHRRWFKASTRRGKRRMTLRAGALRKRRRPKSDLSNNLTVKAAWDTEAKVWYIEDSNLPGLHIEAETLDELRNKLPGAIEDLLEGSGEREVPFKFIALGHATIPA